MKVAQAKLALVALCLTAALAAEESHVVVRAASGAMIFLDGELVGMTSAKEGETSGELRIAATALGSHEVRAVKAGFKTQVSTVEFTGDAATIEMGEFQPLSDDEIAQRHLAGAAPSSEQSGTIEIHKTPPDCVIEVPVRGFKELRKKPDRSLYLQLPEGVYVLIFTIGKKRVVHHAWVQPGTNLHIDASSADGDLKIAQGRKATH